MSMRRDAGYAAASIVRSARKLAKDIGSDRGVSHSNSKCGQRHSRPFITGGRSAQHRSGKLRLAEQQLYNLLNRLAKRENVYIVRCSLARYEAVERHAHLLGHSVRRLPSGAGHDAQAFAPNCPTGMIFVPSVGGVSHNIKEHTDVKDIEAGADILLHMLVELANRH